MEILTSLLTRVISTFHSLWIVSYFYLMGNWKHYKLFFHMQMKDIWILFSSVEKASFESICKFIP